MEDLFINIYVEIATFKTEFKLHADKWTNPSEQEQENYL